MPLRFALTILLFPAAGLLGACGPNGDASQATGTDPEAARPDTSMIRDVSPEQTLGLLADGVAAASPSLAIQTLDQWIERIDSAQVEGAEADSLAALSDDLTRLRNLLQSSPLDGPAIGRALREAGEATAALVEPGTPLDRLAQTLRQQGLRLAPDTTRADSTEVGVREDS